MTLPNLRKLARGRDCMVRVEGVCNFNPDTTVLAHLGGAGIARKSDDRLAAWSCSDCHDWIDGRVRQPALSQSMRRLYHLEGVIRTQQALIDEGLL